MNTRVHDSRPSGPCRNGAGKVVDILEAKAGNLRDAARLAMNNPTRRKVLKLLVTSRSGVKYRTLFQTLDVSERWVREIVADLRRAGIVRTKGSPAHIEFVDVEMAAAVKEILAFLCSDWIEAITGEKDASTALSINLSDRVSTAQTEQYMKTMVNLLRNGGG